MRFWGMIVVLLVLQTSAFAQDVPLAIPKKAKPGKKTDTALTERDLQAQRPRIGLIVGPKVGGAFGVAGPLGASVFAAVELGYRLPVLRRILSISVEPSFMNPGSARATELGTLKGPTIAISTPLLIGGNIEAGPGLVRILAGPSIDWMQSTTNVAGFEFNDTALAMGFVGAAGYLFNIGPGGLGVELRYHVTAPRVAGTPGTSHMLGLTAAYVFDI